MALSKIIKEGLKTTAKRGRKGRYAKAAASRKKTMEAKAIAEGRVPKKKLVMKQGEARKIAEKGRKGDIKSLTAKQKAERSRLIAQVKKEMDAAKKGLTEKPKLQKMVSTIERKPGEKLTELSLNMVPASKIELDPILKNYSRKQIRRLVSTGQAKIVKTKDGEKLKGALNKIKAPEFAVGDSIVELNKVLLIKRGFLPVLKKKSSGLGLFVGGVVITAAGTFIGYASTLVFEEGGPFIIVTAVGITTAIGIDIVGVSVAIEGVKLISQKVKWPIGDKWKASLN